MIYFLEGRARKITKIKNTKTNTKKQQKNYISSKNSNKKKYITGKTQLKKHTEH